jgi:hypothetical protein
MNTCEIIELSLAMEGQNKCFTMNFFKGVPTSLKVFYNNLFELILNNIRYRKSMKLTKY